MIVSKRINDTYVSHSVNETYGLYDVCDPRGQGILKLRGWDHAHGLLNLVMEAPHK